MDDNNKRIVKNTFYLYIRMFVITALGFVSTRVVLEKLGASDYGINNLVAGFVSMFTVLNSILASSTRRFLALHLGKGDKDLLKRTFSTANSMHIIIAIVVVVVLEICGIWFLNNKLNIEPDRLWAARWVFHISVFSVFWGITQSPFSAVVTAHENFSMYAIMSIYDVVAKLFILYVLIIIPFDKLIVYSLLTMSVNLIGLFVYRAYCLRKYEECTNTLHIDKPLCREMLRFSGWGTLGHVITVVNSQGNSILLNLFYNTVMNAARGLATTVSVMIAQFIAGFLTAAQPQLIKYWGAGEKEKFTDLIFNATQYTLFLVALIGVPVILEIDYVLFLWLENVPDYTSSFIKITVICSVIYRSNTMIDQGITAAGYVKQLNILSVPVYLLTIPLVYLALSMGWGPIVAYWFASIPPLLSFFINLWILSRYTDFPSRRYFFQIFLRNFLLILLAMLLPYYIQSKMQPGLIRFLVVCLSSEVCTVAILYVFGLNKHARLIVKQQLVGRFVDSKKK